jgi:hypothetical protein
LIDIFPKLRTSGPQKLPSKLQLWKFLEELTANQNYFFPSLASLACPVNGYLASKETRQTENSNKFIFT